MTSLSEILKDHQEFHSDIQIDAFIIGRSGGTIYGCYKQAMREIASRVGSLRDRYLSRELLLLEIDDLERNDSRRDRLNAAAKRLAMGDCDRLIGDTERELLRFWGQAIACREALKRDGIVFPLSAEDRDMLDRQMWEHNIKGMCAVEFMANGRLSQKTLELIQCLPVSMRKTISESIDGDNKKSLTEWWMTCEPAIPEPVAIEHTDLRRLIECS